MYVILAFEPDFFTHKHYHLSLSLFRSFFVEPIFVFFCFVRVDQGKVVQKDYTNPASTVYIVNGAGGNVEGHSTGTATPDYMVLFIGVLWKFETIKSTNQRKTL